MGLRKPNWIIQSLFVLLFFCTIPNGSAAESDMEAVRGEIQALKAKIQELEPLKERLNKLEEKLAEAQEAQARAEAVEKKEAVQEEGLKLGGALRFTYAYRDFKKDSRDKGGDLEFDIFRLNLDGAFKDILISAEYRWYSYMNVIHHGWVGYDFTGAWQGQLGVTEVPFGILPYASHNWWFGVPYYVGLEDDYDLGFKMIYDQRPWNLQWAFFKNGEWGDPSNLDRYSFDVVEALGQTNEETNQINGRLAYTWDRSGLGSTELGLSGQLGQLYNRTTGSMGTHWAAAAHLNGFYGPWNLMLECARYSFSPKNPPGMDDRTVIMGAFGTAFPVAADGTLVVANLSYDFPLTLGPINKLTFYNDYSILLKDEDDFHNTQINTLGCLISAPPIYTYVDLVMGKNAPFLGVPTDIHSTPHGLGPGDPDADWETRFNINIGYYF
ncbi:MAG: hypothetical protein ACQEQ7_14880 [Thermodesulfobacteriota bacterium]